MADALADQSRSIKDGVLVERHYKPEEGAEVVHSANLTLCFVIPLIDHLLGGKNAEEISLVVRKWSGQS
ncbi:MAG TPA: hypothetical protein VOA41_11675 [Candidatus Dormibacteraeota bacterium]|nr:hypothetical protein [Candidatus Dormibacteraeota bacterium]